MTVISKELFYEKVGDEVSCEFFHYWKPNCIGANFGPFWLWNIVKGSGTFFLPIYIMKLLLTYRKKNLKTLLLNLIKSELRTIAYGIAMGTTMLSSICLLRHIFGRLYYYNILMIPGFLSGFSILIESEENQVLDTLIFFNSFIETLLRKMRLHKLWETILFMGISGSLMHLLEKRSTEEMGFTHFWTYMNTYFQSQNKEMNLNSLLILFGLTLYGLINNEVLIIRFYVPPKKIQEENVSGLSNSEDGNAALVKLFTKYFSIGYGINIIKKMLPRFGLILNKPSELLSVLFNKSNVYFGLFIGSYVAIYEIITTIFTRNSVIDKKYHRFLAGLLSGISYTISPNLQVLVIAITTSLQMVYDFVSKKMKITDHYWQRAAVYAFSHGMMLHNKFLYPDTCSPYYKKMVDACTNDVSKKIYENLLMKYFFT